MFTTTSAAASNNVYGRLSEARGCLPLMLTAFEALLGIPFCYAFLARELLSLQPILPAEAFAANATPPVE